MDRTRRDELKSQHGQLRILEFSYNRILRQSKGGVVYLSIQCFKDMLDKCVSGILFVLSHRNYPALSQTRFRCIL